jgi:hypothetical protein
MLLAVPQKFNDVMVDVVRPVSIDAASCRSLK